MIHSANGGIAQYLNSSCLFEVGWTKNVIDTSIIDCSIAGRASKVAKVAQDMTVRLAVVFQVVSIKIALVRSLELEVEIAGDKDRARLRLRLSPVD